MVRIYLSIIGLCVVMFFTGFFANAFEVPEDAVIKVYTKDGKKIGEMKRSNYKVIKIEDKKPKKSKCPSVPAKEEEEEEQVYYNSIIVHLGAGMDGLSAGHDGDNHVVKERKRPVFGATYCYTENGIGLCGTGLTNKTGLLGIKKDF